MDSRDESALRVSLRQSFQSSPPRPLLHHLSADTSWLLQIPILERDTSQNEKYSRFSFYNILIDPWLCDSQVDFHPRFSEQWHASPPCVTSIAELETLLHNIERLALSELGLSPTFQTTHSPINLVLLSHEFTDHTHRATLLQLSSTVPILAVSKSASLIRSWSHFHVVHDIQPLAGDWHDPRCLTPAWLGVWRVLDRREWVPLHAALWIVIQLPGAKRAEGVIYTPHGVLARCLDEVREDKSGVRALALVHGLNEANLMGNTINLGAHNGLSVWKALKPKYWCATHDEIKVGTGLIGKILKIKGVSVEEAILKTGIEGEVDMPNFMHVQNGQHLVLEEIIKP